MYHLLVCYDLLLKCFRVIKNCILFYGSNYSIIFLWKRHTFTLHLPQFKIKVFHHLISNWLSLPNTDYPYLISTDIMINEIRKKHMNKIMIPNCNPLFKYIMFNLYRIQNNINEINYQHSHFCLLLYLMQQSYKTFDE